MHSLIRLLDELGAIKEERLGVFYPRVRDREDISVLRDPISEVIVLSRIDQASAEYYQERKEAEACMAGGKAVKSPRLEDNIRRARDFQSLFRGKHWLDFGCGLGGMLDEVAHLTASATGFDLNRQRSEIVGRRGHRVVSSPDEIRDNSLDLITLFHVLEHLPEPVDLLRALIPKLKTQGLLVIEVPHARDALITLYESEAYKQFTFWSEHLVLHTRQSLSLVLSESGLRQIQVKPYQRYPLANHLYWLSVGKPGGQVAWSMISNEKLDSEYGALLEELDRTDSLIAICRV